MKKDSNRKHFGASNMEKQKHPEIKNAVIYGAVCQTQGTSGNWIDRRAVDLLSGLIDDCGADNLRVKPDCEYAIEKIRQLGGDEAVELYQYWLDGGTLESNYFVSTGIKEVTRTAIKEHDPFDLWMNNWLKCYDQLGLRKKKKVVKEVLWVGYLDKIESFEYRWEKLDDNPPETGIFKWHKVPTCTREVEV